MTQRVKLTVALIGSAVEKGFMTVKGTRLYEVQDAVARGLELRCRSAGVATYSVRYRINAKTRRYTIGRADDIGLAEAREKVQALRLLIAQGIDP